MGQGRKRRSAWAAAAICAAAVLGHAEPAAAGLYHSLPAACSFGEDGTSGSSFGNVQGRGVAFQQAERRLYATRSAGEPSFVFGFDASALCPSGSSGGYPLLPGFDPLEVPSLNTNDAAVAADDTTLSSAGNVYLSDRTRIEGVDDEAGELPGGFPISKPVPKQPLENTQWKALAVDPEGHLWGAAANRVLHEFSAGGEELDELDLGPVFASGNPIALAFDAQGDLYVSSSKLGAGVWKLPAPAHDPAAAVEVSPVSASALAVDRSSGDLYAARSGLSGERIDRYDSEGNLVESFPATPPAGEFTGVAVDEATKALYAFARGGGVDKVLVFEAVVLPDVATGPLSDLAETSATLNGTVDPAGLELEGCELEWVSEAAFEASGFEDLSSGGEAACEPPFATLDKEGGPQAVSAPATGLVPETRYRFRVSAANENGANSSDSVSFALAKPGVETVGSPIRSATTARLDARIDPHGIPTEYRFEYLSEAQFQADGESFGAGTQATPKESAGSGGLITLASAQISGLSPATTYRYRALAENEGFGEASGEPRALTTRATDDPLAHGAFPGPPGSDRAWEQVSIPDSSGNPISGASGIAASGKAAFYGVKGGTPISEIGTGVLPSFLFARRPPGAHPTEGWRQEQIFPSREEAPYSSYRPLAGDGELTGALALNVNPEGETGAGAWRLKTASREPQKLYESPPGVYGGLYLFSDNLQRAILTLNGSLDPAHPAPAGKPELYDVSSGEPQLVGLLPGDVVPSCGVKGEAANVFAYPLNSVARATHWLSADGARLFFPVSCSGTTHLYMREIEAGSTVAVDGHESAALEGPDCSGAMIRSTPTAVYFWTQSKLDPSDSEIEGACEVKPGEFSAGGDVYRYLFATGEYECLTCVAPGGKTADVLVGSGAEGAGRTTALAPGGQRLYFLTRARLLGGAPEAGAPQLYRVDLQSGALAFVAPLKAGDTNFRTSADGRYLAFSSASPALNALSGSDNAKSTQAYLYDDAERSLSCASCPADGAPPRSGATAIVADAFTGPNMTPLAENGTLAFATPTALVGADQNTAATGEDPSVGNDVYEWRDGRALLVSDGLGDWPDQGPKVATISPSGRDLFFTEAAQLTPDALDGYRRLYDARIGGGIEFPKESSPCPLEACQGIPAGAPEEALPGSSSFAGPGNPRQAKARKRHCPKGKRRVTRRGKSHCVAKHRKQKKHRHRHKGKKGRA